MSRSAAALLCLLCSLPAARAADTPATGYGQKEHVQVLGAQGGVEVTAQLGGGQSRTVIYSREIKYFLRDGKTWVRFVVDNGSVLTGKRLIVEKPLIKDERIPQRDGSIEHIARVRGELCVGSTRFETEWRVSDRTKFTAPLLLGSEDLARLGHVEAGREFLREPDCGANATFAVPAAALAPLPAAAPPAPGIARAAAPASAATAVAVDDGRRCDGRSHCSQMSSCEEAKWFLNHCPGMKMDGDGDGIPCEDQFCGH